MRVRLREITIDDVELIDAWQADPVKNGEFNDFGGEARTVRPGVEEGRIIGPNGGMLIVERIADAQPIGTVGAAGRRSFATIGDTTNLGSRLMSAAAPGQVVVGPETHRQLEMLRAFALEPLGPVRIKGKRDPVEAWRLGQASPRSFE